MTDFDYTFIQNLADFPPEIPEDSIVSRTVLDTPAMKATLFGFAAGQEMTEHTAAYPAVLQVLEGNGTLQLGQDKHTISPGSWVYMPPRLPHSLQAEQQLLFILVLVKGSAADS